VAPGIDVVRDILAHMEFKPDIAQDLRTMDARIFRPEKMGLGAIIAGNPRPVRSPRLEVLAGG